jgi:hypothetical protein
MNAPGAAVISAKVMGAGCGFDAVAQAMVF